MLVALIVLISYIFRQNRELVSTQRLLIEKHNELNKQLEMQNRLSDEYFKAPAPSDSQANPLAEIANDRDKNEVSGNAMDEESYECAAPLLSKQQSDMLLIAIAKVMEDSHTISDPDFGLQTLANLVGSNTKYVSWAINATYGKNFKTYLNEYRIREASRRLADTEKYGNPDFSAMSDTLIYDLYQKVYAMGSAYLRENGQGLKMGTISTRPTDRRENYVKRCVGLPGQTLQIKDHIVYLDGKANKEPDNVQYSYYVKLKQSIPEEVMQEYGISMEQLRDLNQFGTMPLTAAAKKGLESRTDIVESIRLNTDAPVGEVYPRNGNTGWTRDNYGPVWIPAKGKSIKLNMQNIAVYERPIRAYEGNELKVENGKIFINGKETDEYTFKLDYYWMMGDNRHNSADSRYWGFVPEDHIVGKPIFVWWSSDPDRSGFGGVRWNRLFKWVDKIK